MYAKIVSEPHIYDNKKIKNYNFSFFVNRIFLRKCTFFDIYDFKHLPMLKIINITMGILFFGNATFKSFIYNTNCKATHVYV